MTILVLLVMAQAFIAGLTGGFALAAFLEWRDAVRDRRQS